MIVQAGAGFCVERSVLLGTRKVLGQSQCSQARFGAVLHGFGYGEYKTSGGAQLEVAVGGQC